MTKGAPTKIIAYLAELKAALHGAPAALIRDALADAEEFLRGEIPVIEDRTFFEAIRNNNERRLVKCA